MQWKTAYLRDAVAAGQQGDFAKSRRMARLNRLPTNLRQEIPSRLSALTEGDHDHGAVGLAAVRIGDGRVIANSIDTGPRGDPAERIARNSSPLKLDR